MLSGALSAGLADARQRAWGTKFPLHCDLRLKHTKIELNLLLNTLELQEMGFVGLWLQVAPSSPSSPSEHSTPKSPVSTSQNSGFAVGKTAGACAYAECNKAGLSPCPLCQKAGVSPVPKVSDREILFPKIGKRSHDINSSCIYYCFLSTQGTKLVINVVGVFNRAFPAVLAHARCNSLHGCCLPTNFSSSRVGIPSGSSLILGERRRALQESADCQERASSNLRRAACSRYLYIDL